jgi:hypothetical protein
MSLALMDEAIRRETSGKPSIREIPAEFWAVDNSLRMVLLLCFYAGNLT